MEFLTIEHVAAWCAEHGIIFSDNVATGNRIRLPSVVGDPSDITLPTEALRLIALTMDLTQSQYFQHPKQYLLFISDFDIWSEEFEAIGMTLLNSMQFDLHNKRTIVAAPGRVYDFVHRVDLQAALFVIMAFQWDAYLLRDDHDLLIKISHDGYLHSWASTEANHESMKMLFAAWS